MTNQQRQAVLRLNMRVQRVTGKISVPYLVNKDGTVEILRSNKR